MKYFNQIYVRTKTEFVNDSCGTFDRDCDFHNFLSCDLEGVCDGNEKWFNHQLEKPRIVSKTCQYILNRKCEWL